MEYKAVVCDLDGTLLNKDHKIADLTIETIKKVMDKGILFFLATGRPHLDAKKFKEMLGMNSYMISCNGAKIHDKDDKEVYGANIPADICKKIFAEKIESNIHKSVYKDDIWYLEDARPEFKDFHRESGFTYTLTKFENLKDQDITKFIYLNENSDELQKLESRLENKYGSFANVTMSSTTCLEIMAKNVSKKNALEHILNKINLDPKEVISFGDGLNDADMLSYTGKGYIMGNSDRRLKERLSNSEVIDTNDNYGVAKKLRSLFL